VGHWHIDKASVVGTLRDAEVRTRVGLDQTRGGLDTRARDRGGGTVDLGIGAAQAAVLEALLDRRVDSNTHVSPVFDGTEPGGNRRVANAGAR
jgi:hypothetical protein